MELNYFKDMLFNVLNDTDEIDIEDIETDDSNDRFELTTTDGSIFEIKCQKIN